MGLVTNALLVALASLIFYIVFRVREAFKYFEKRGMRYLPPSKMTKNTLRLMFGLDGQIELFQALYENMKDMKVGGFYQLTKPCLLVTDPATINQILIKDFSHFRDHGILTDFQTNPLEAHIFNLEGDEWKAMRNKLVPTFTSGKLKGAFEIIEGCAQELVRTADTLVEKKDAMIKDLFWGYTAHVTGSFAFGIELGDLQSEDNPFIKIAKKVFEPNVVMMAKMVLKETLPSFIAKCIKIQTVTPDIDQFFHNLVNQAFEHRLKTGFSRKDFVQLLLELREKGTVEVAAKEWEEETERPEDLPEGFKLDLTDTLLTAQAFVFFVAGFETTASAMSFTSYFLSKNPRVQDKLRNEVREVKKKNGGKLTYEGLSQLNYLECCIMETLRMYPPLPQIFRKCTKDYVFEDGAKVEKGTAAFIPIHAIQHDPEYFEDPEEYKPERFIGGNIKPGTYLPFGDGPRICIGKRLALLAAKLGLAYLIDQHKLEPSEKMEEPIRTLPGSFVTLPRGGIWVRVGKAD